jgi:exodeoxyribonuclease VII large subunit
VGEPVAKVVGDDLLRLAAVGLHPPDLHPPGAVRVEVDELAVRGELRAVVETPVRQARLLAAGRRRFTAPLERVRDEERRLDDWNDRLRRAASQRLETAQRRLEALAAQLDTLSPLNVLGRGYSLTLKEADGAVVRSASQVRPGDRLLTRIGDGRIVSRVEETTANDPPPPSPEVDAP